MVYCLEEADNESNLHLLKLLPDAAFVEEETLLESERVLSLKATGLRQMSEADDRLYRDYRQPRYEDVLLHWIPYYAWANRGEGEMQVWTRY